MQFDSTLLDILLDEHSGGDCMDFLALFMKRTQMLTLAYEGTVPVAWPIPLADLMDSLHVLI